MNNSLIGFWVVKRLDMSESLSIRMLAGLPSEVIEFSEDGQYQIIRKNKIEAKYVYEVRLRDELIELDVWMASLPSFVTHCLAQISGNYLNICVAGNGGERPDSIRRDDGKPWVIMQFERTKTPKIKAKGQIQTILESDSLIPSAFKNNGPDSFYE